MLLAATIVGNPDGLRTAGCLQGWPVGSTGIAGNWGTAVFDAVDTSLGFAAEGVHPKKAVLVITDGIDTSSRRSSSDVQKAIRAYVLAVDASDEPGPFALLMTASMPGRSEG